MVGLAPTSWVSMPQASSRRRCCCRYGRGGNLAHRLLRRPTGRQNRPLRHNDRPGGDDESSGPLLESTDYYGLYYGLRRGFPPNGNSRHRSPNEARRRFATPLVECTRRCGEDGGRKPARKNRPAYVRLILCQGQTMDVIARSETTKQSPGFGRFEIAAAPFGLLAVTTPQISSTAQFNIERCLFRLNIRCTKHEIRNNTK